MAGVLSRLFGLGGPAPASFRFALSRHLTYCTIANSNSFDAALRDMMQHSWSRLYLRNYHKKEIKGIGLGFITGASTGPLNPLASQRPVVDFSISYNGRGKQIMVCIILVGGQRLSSAEVSCSR